MKHLRILSYVDEVARTGSIRKAADQLNVTASAVNRRIMDLEEELGAPLFERRPRGVRLTAAGEVFVNYLRQQDGEVERMKSQIEDLKGMRRGTVRIACSQALALEFLPRADRRIPQAASVRGVRREGVRPRAGDDGARGLRGRSGAGVPAAVSRQFPAADDAGTAHRCGDVVRAIRSPAKRTVRLRDCAAYPVALPERSIGGRQLLEEVMARSRISFQRRGRIEFVRDAARPGAAKPT